MTMSTPSIQRQLNSVQAYGAKRGLDALLKLTPLQDKGFGHPMDQPSVPVPLDQ